MKSKFLYLALFFTILCFPFKGNEHETIWLWAKVPWVPVILGSLALAFVGVHFYQRWLGR